MEKKLFDVGLQVSLDLGKYSEDISTTIIGWITDAFFVTRLPYIDRKPLTIFSGNRCLIRLLNSGVVYGFHTEVISIQYAPVPLIFFKYPINVIEVPVRKSKRIVTNISAKIECAENFTVDATIINLSEGGCLLKSPAPKNKTHEAENELAINKNCKLSFMVIDKTLENIECIVKRVRTNDDALLLGMQFTNVTSENKEIINSLIDSIGISEI